MNEQVCAVLDFPTKKAKSGLLHKIRGLPFTIHQEGDVDLVIIFRKETLSLFTKALGIRRKRHWDLTDKQRELLAVRLIRARQTRAEIRKERNHN